MIFKVALLAALLFQIVYLLLKINTCKQKRYYIPALLVSLITIWLIYKTYTMSGFGAINSAVFSGFGLLVSLIFTKYPPFSKGENGCFFNSA
ncbi:hypothetical protein LCM20_16645 [Halobacillus litoralis]|uniref:hypothetical protein n=1 Tax=Halobacillus litoralis TaxID=45668 RepID=UPI001CD19803|nr:hypothetical protein [Halobacillus litoralis]MCA0972239.1 hypothetical protein [Halobacillus litoralis]